MSVIAYIYGQSDLPEKTKQLELFINIKRNIILIDMGGRINLKELSKDELDIVDLSLKKVKR